MRSTAKTRFSLSIRGAVQGVGFRPFIYRLAQELKLHGWINNNLQGVLIEVEGMMDNLSRFLLRIEREKPPQSFISSFECTHLDSVGYKSFEIRESNATGKKTAILLPDVATCTECVREIFDPNNRRYRYPFTNCTNCGPRFTIIEALPYDRSRTTMKRFKMCEECMQEYLDPSDRRFHAQPNACPTCGPHLEWWNSTGQLLSSDNDALLEASEAIKRGEIVAVKGLGGFQLIVDAGNERAVDRLRLAKMREEKPFALMYPSLELVKRDCEVSAFEERLLISAESPIVLLRRKAINPYVSTSVAPGNPNLGIMLPYTPLHHLLMAELSFPIVATSGNRCDEPICIDELEAIEKLNNIAQYFLVHNRPIKRYVDDSIVTFMMDRELVLRRSRGYAPLPIRIKQEFPTILAVGSHLKNTVAVSKADQLFLSQHIGDLKTKQSFEAFQEVINSFLDLYELDIQAISCDAHPAYSSTSFAKEFGKPCVPVQHHYAHVLSCMAENELRAPVLGIAWDGTGYGLDKTIWGGEFLHINDRDFERVAHFRKFCLPGGESAIKEPRRTALGVLYELFKDSLFDMKGIKAIEAFSKKEIEILRIALKQNINAPVTSSVGRLFDSVAAIAGLRQKVRFEGQAAMGLEFSLYEVKSDESYPFEICNSSSGNQPLIIDWGLMINGILDDVSSNVPVPLLSCKFHNTLVEIIVSVAYKVSEQRVALTGGCFQNKYLTERSVQRLREEGFRPYWHQRIPPNDGGIALGQLIAAARLIREDRVCA
jgi:hydrogenase maturation protein HypF